MTKIIDEVMFEIAVVYAKHKLLDVISVGIESNVNTFKIKFSRL